MYMLRQVETKSWLLPLIFIHTFQKICSTSIRTWSAEEDLQSGFICKILASHLVANIQKAEPSVAKALKKKKK